MQFAVTSRAKYYQISDSCRVTSYLYDQLHNPNVLARKYFELQQSIFVMPIFFLVFLPLEKNLKSLKIFISVDKSGKKLSHRIFFGRRKLFRVK